MKIIAISIGEKTFQVELSDLIIPGQQLQVSVDGQTIPVVIPTNWFEGDEMEWLIINNQPYEVKIDREMHWIQSEFGTFRIEVRDRETNSVHLRSNDGRVKAPIPGLIRRVFVDLGETVEIGEPLVVLEAMKMENEIRAPLSGKVRQINIKLGQSVAQDEVLLEIE